MFILCRAVHGSVQIVKHLFKICEEVLRESDPFDAGVETNQKLLSGWSKDFSVFSFEHSFLFALRIPWKSKVKLKSVSLEKEVI